MWRFLRWTLGGWWRFVGLLVLIGVSADGIAEIILACLGKVRS